MSDERASHAPDPSGKRLIVTVLGSLEILSWGSTFYFPAVFAIPIVRDTGWPYAWVVGGLSVGLLVAGLVSPRIGRAIGAYGGRPILALGTLLLALGLVLIGTSQNLIWYFAGWIVLGTGMGAGLYDAAFSTLGVIYGKHARGAIAGVTLIGGFASTVCWPFSAYLVEHVGWRMACFVYSVIYLAIAMPLYLLALPRRWSTKPFGKKHAPPKPRPPHWRKKKNRSLSCSPRCSTTAASILCDDGGTSCGAVAGAWPRPRRRGRARHADRPVSRRRALCRDARRKPLSPDLDHDRVGRAGGARREPVSHQFVAVRRGHNSLRLRQRHRHDRERHAAAGAVRAQNATPP